jgi:GTP cyclohydrolase I
MYAEVLGGVDLGDECLRRVFDASDDDAGDDTGIVMLRNIEFYSMCEHHLLPFNGVAHVAYIPRNSKVVGLSKLARIVHVYARRLQLQERIGRQVADALENELHPEGVAVILEAKHGCMSCRGVRLPRASMVTSTLRGLFKEQQDARAELFSLIQLGEP